MVRMHYSYREIPTEACVGASNQLAFEVKAYDLREWRYEQFCIIRSLLLCHALCYSG